MCSNRKRRNYIPREAGAAKSESNKDRSSHAVPALVEVSSGDEASSLYNSGIKPRNNPGDTTSPQTKGTAESIILATSGLWVALHLVQSNRHQGWTEAFLLLVLMLAAIAVERSLEAVICRLYLPREGARSGLALGLATLPLIFAARVVQDGRGARAVNGTTTNGIPPRLGLWVTMSCSAGALGAAIAASVVRKRIACSSKGGGSLREKGPRGWVGWWPQAIGWFTGTALFVAAWPLLAGASGVSIFGEGSSNHAGFVLAHGWACGLLLHILLASFPACVSTGEGLLVAEGLTLLVGDLVFRTIAKGWPSAPLPPHSFRGLVGVGSEIEVIVQAMAVGVLVVPLLSDMLRRASMLTSPAFLVRASSPSPKDEAQFANVVCTACFYAALGFIVVVAAPAWLKSVVGLQMHPALWALTHVMENAPVRLMLCGYWLAVMLAPLRALRRMSAHGLMARILVRKWYHIMAVGMFVPALIVQANFLRLAFGVALAGLLVVEMLRVARIPPFGEAINGFMGAFVDARDSDRLIISHFSLLLGCALPLWLSPALSDRPLAAFAGILGVGIGDTTASVVGYKYGRIPISRGSRKTVEGTCAGILSMLVACLLLSPLLPYPPSSLLQCMGVVVATTVAGSLEAHTTQLDNAFVPLVYFSLLSL